MQLNANWTEFNNNEHKLELFDQWHLGNNNDNGNDNDNDNNNNNNNNNNNIIIKK